jgi:Rrf2 family protein
MKLKTRARYALRSMVEIARATSVNQPVSLERVAHRTGISRRYLEQLTRCLREAELVVSVRGRSGGYLLSRSAEGIRVGQIVEAVIGPINIVDCVMQPEQCLIADVCECREIYKAINERVLQAMNDYSLAQLAFPSKSQDPRPPWDDCGQVAVQIAACQSPCSSR